MLSWQDLILSVATRTREPDIVLDVRTAEADVPYSSLDTVERMLYRASLMLLREVSPSELEAVGSLGLATQLGITTGHVVPFGAYAVVNATIQQASGGYILADMVHPAVWLEQYTVPSANAAIYTFTDGKVQFKGTLMNITYRREPLIEEFRTDVPIFPAGFDEDRIDLTRKLLYITDFLPQARL